MSFPSELTGTPSGILQRVPCGGGSVAWPAPRIALGAAREAGTSNVIHGPSVSPIDDPMHVVHTASQAGRAALPGARRIGSKNNPSLPRAHSRARTGPAGELLGSQRPGGRGQG